MEELGKSEPTDPVEVGGCCSMPPLLPLPVATPPTPYPDETAAMLDEVLLVLTPLPRMPPPPTIVVVRVDPVVAFDEDDDVDDEEDEEEEEDELEEDWGGSGAMIGC